MKKMKAGSIFAVTFEDFIGYRSIASKVFNFEIYL